MVVVLKLHSSICDLWLSSLCWFGIVSVIELKVIINQSCLKPFNSWLNHVNNESLSCNGGPFPYPMSHFRPRQPLSKADYYPTIVYQGGHLCRASWCGHDVLGGQTSASGPWLPCRQRSCARKLVCFMQLSFLYARKTGTFLRQEAGMFYATFFFIRPKDRQDLF